MSLTKPVILIIFLPAHIHSGCFPAGCWQVENENLHKLNELVVSGLVFSLDQNDITNPTPDIDGEVTVDYALIHATDYDTTVEILTKTEKFILPKSENIIKFSHNQTSEKFWFDPIKKCLDDGDYVSLVKLFKKRLDDDVLIPEILWDCSQPSIDWSEINKKIEVLSWPAEQKKKVTLLTSKYSERTPMAVEYQKELAKVMCDIHSNTKN